MINCIFAQSFDIGANWGVNMTYFTVKNENEAVTSMFLFGVPLGIDMSYFFNNRIGINAYFNYTIVASVLGGFTAIGATWYFDETNLKSKYTFDACIGPVFDLLGKKNFSLPLAVGIHLTHTHAEIDVPTTVFSARFSSMEYGGTQFGLGTSFGFRYIFDAGFYVATGMKLAVDFLGKIKAKGNTFDGGEMSPTDTSFTLVYSFFFGGGYRFRMKGKDSAS
jgi:hypothetical protein